ncbi:hypothetical protein DL96DRAFT_1714275 [Flagelloscypha sp. PMI_526]|nr:hypothetical protein DL96DRAFT_1714275 [Flagelloscypha sp. PMI_526]
MSHCCIAPSEPPPLTVSSSFCLLRPVSLAPRPRSPPRDESVRQTYRPIRLPPLSPEYDSPSSSSSAPLHRDVSSSSGSTSTGHSPIFMRDPSHSPHDSHPPPSPIRPREFSSDPQRHGSMSSTYYAHPPSPQYPSPVSPHYQSQSQYMVAHAPPPPSNVPPAALPAEGRIERRLRYQLGLHYTQPLTLDSIDDPGDKRKPNPSYILLVQLAILSSPTKALTLQEIFSALQNRFLYFRDHPESNAPWKGSIRNILSLRTEFERIPTNDQEVIEHGRTRGKWRVTGVFGETRTRYRRSKITGERMVRTLRPVILGEEDFDPPYPPGYEEDLARGAVGMSHRHIPPRALQLPPIQTALQSSAH